MSKLRMLCINPIFLCDKHLTAEHDAIHKIHSKLSTSKNIDTDFKESFDEGLIDTSLIYSEHKKLTDELKSRGTADTSPLNFIKFPFRGGINSGENLSWRLENCKECTKLWRAVNNITDKRLGK